MGDIVFDQLVFVPPVGIPPGDDYQISVGFFNPDSGKALPRLDAERFAGLEVRFAANLVIKSSSETPTEAQKAAACAGIPRQEIVVRDGLYLAGWTTSSDRLRPGETLLLRLCWQTTTDSLPQEAVTWTLAGPETHTLYSGPPAGAFDFSQWRDGEVVEARYVLRVPKDAAAGRYTLMLAIDDAAAIDFGLIDVQAVSRIFDLPDDMLHEVEVDFGESVRLRGYVFEALPSGNALDVTLYWQSLAEVDADYVVFIHLLDQTTGQIVTQADEMPHYGDYPTSLWVDGEIVIDRHTLTTSNALPAGTYLLRLGFYLAETGDYLAVDGAADVILPPLTIGP